MTSDVAVVILAGGEGKRMGGGKPLKAFAGQRLIDRAVDQARQLSDIVAIAVRDRSQAGGVAARLIADAEVPGPLGGLVSGMRFAQACGRPLLLAIPADMPFLPGDLFERLHHAIGGKHCALAASGGQLHPICSLWRTSDLAAVAAYAASGRRSLKGLAQHVGFVTVEWPTGDRDPFFNVNTSDDLAEAVRRDR